MFPELQVLDNCNKDGEEIFSDEDDDDDYGQEDFSDGQEPGQEMFIEDYGDEGFEGGEDDMDDFEGEDSEAFDQQQANKRQKK